MRYINLRFTYLLTYLEDIVFELRFSRRPIYIRRSSIMSLLCGRDFIFLQTRVNKEVSEYKMSHRDIARQNMSAFLG